MEFKPGIEVFFYNKWSGFNEPAIARCFSGLTEEEFKNLKTGEVIWVDEEPYSLNGKVYGFTCKTIVDIKVEDGLRKIYYSGGFSALSHTFARVLDGKKLTFLIMRFPQALERPVV